MKEISQSQLIALLHSKPSTERQQGWNDAIVYFLKMNEVSGGETPFSLGYMMSTANIQLSAATEVATSLYTGGKLHAVKKLKDLTGLGLKECKDIVDQFSEFAEIDNLQETLRGAIAGKKFNF